MPTQEKIYIFESRPDDVPQVRSLIEQAGGDVEQFRALYLERFNCEPDLYDEKEVDGMRDQARKLLIGIN